MNNYKSTIIFAVFVAAMFVGASAWTIVRCVNVCTLKPEATFNMVSMTVFMCLLYGVFIGIAVLLIMHCVNELRNENDYRKSKGEVRQ